MSRNITTSPLIGVLYAFSFSLCFCNLYMLVKIFIIIFIIIYVLPAIGEMKLRVLHLGSL